MKIKFSHRGLHRTSEDERTVKTAYLKPDCRNGSYPAEVFCRTGTQRISSWPGDTPPKNRPDTLTQTFFIHQLFPCSQTADHTFRQLRLPRRRANSNLPRSRLHRKFGIPENSSSGKSEGTIRRDSGDAPTVMSITFFRLNR